MLISLNPGRGTPLWRAPPTGVIIEPYIGDLSSVAGIIGNRYFARGEFTPCEIGASVPFMILNFGQNLVKFSLSSELSRDAILWDPYAYEFIPPPNLDPDVFKTEQAPVPVPEGYQSTLAKWYSIKYSYPTYNLIFVSPELGISFQIHGQRSEHWEILSGNPIVISGSTVTYDASKGREFDIPVGTLHSVVNPSKNEWVAFKETWSGEFDEGDIMRVFNPNRYADPKS